MKQLYILCLLCLLWEAEVFSQQKDSTSRFSYGAYIDFYYACYSDSVGKGNFESFPTAAPKNKTLGLNLAQGTLKYTTSRFKSILTLHYGDIASSAWSQKYNFIQEANAGVRLHPKLWIEAGLFRSHIGLESIQPRENIASSISTVVFYHPYFVSGVKMSYQPTKKVGLAFHIYNGYNTFVETNSNKTLGASLTYSPKEEICFTYHVLFTDELPKEGGRSHRRMYNNTMVVYKKNKIQLMSELNVGWQQNSSIEDSTLSAYMLSSSLTTKYNLYKKVSVYGRGELFYDPHQMLSGPMYNQYGETIRLNLWGLTLGGEYKPNEKSYLRLESRILKNEASGKIFYKGKHIAHRIELSATTGIWF